VLGANVSNELCCVLNIVQPALGGRAVLPTPRRRGLKLAIYVSLALAVAIALHLGAREALASAVALAPNSNRARAMPGSLLMPAELVKLGAFTLETRVGPPEATLVSWVIEPRAPRFKGTVVLLHGVRMDKRSLAPMGAALAADGYRAVLVDLRGHGESSGRYLTYGSVEVQDISSVLDALRARGLTLGCTGVYGFSYGGAVALELSARDPRITAVVAVASFSTLREVVNDYRHKYLPAALSMIPSAWFQGAVDEAGRIAQFDPDRIAPLRAVSRSSAALLLIHGTADTQVPLRHSQALFGAATGNARLVTVAGAEHAAMPGDSTGVVRRETLAWFDQWLGSGACLASSR
jgi:dipeptidyl aminopeptidase/acylaminoacyl peptidase